MKTNDVILNIVWTQYEQLKSWNLPTEELESAILNYIEDQYGHEFDGRDFVNHTFEQVIYLALGQIEEVLFL